MIVKKRDRVVLITQVIVVVMIRVKNIYLLYRSKRNIHIICK